MVDFDMRKVDWEKVEEEMDKKAPWVKKRLEGFVRDNPGIDWAFGDGPYIDLDKTLKPSTHAFLHFCLWHKHPEGNNRRMAINPCRIAEPDENESFLFARFFKNLLDEATDLRGRLVRVQEGLFVYNLGPKDLPIKEGK